MAFVRIPGKERNYQDTETGAIVSRRQYLKSIRAGLSNEKFAQLNKLTNPELSVLRPARGHKSALKLSEAEKHIIAQARIEDAERKKELKKAATEQRKQTRATERELKRLQSKKHVKRRHITGRLLKAGKYAARIPFEEYDDYVVMLAEAKASGIIFSYSLGMQGYHETTHKELDITVYTQMYVGNKPIDRDNFYAAMNEELEERMYFQFLNYWIHFSFKVDYAEDKARKAVESGKLPKRYLARMESNKKARSRNK